MSLRNHNKTAGAESQPGSHKEPDAPVVDKNVDVAGDEQEHEPSAEERTSRREARRAERQQNREARRAERQQEEADEPAPVREPRQERQRTEPRKEQPKEPAEQPFQGAKKMSTAVGLFRQSGASGRASSFIGQFNKHVKDNINDLALADFQKNNSMLLLREFKNEIVTFIALVSAVEDKLYYNLIIVENKESIIQDRNRKSDRRERRRGRVDQDVRVYQDLPAMLNEGILSRINDYILDNAGSHVKAEDLMYTGYTTLSYTVPLETIDTIKPILGSAYEANMEAAGILEHLDNEYFKEEGIQLEGIIGTAGTQAATGYDGRPIRNDITVSIETFSNATDRSPLDNDKEGQQWSTGSAYVDLVPGMSLWNEGGDDRRNSKTSANACLTARVVFQEVDIYQSEERGPLVRLMATIATAIELGKSNRFLKPFMPRAFNNSRDRELEALGYLMDPEGKVPPARLEFDNPNDDREIYSFLEKMIRHDKGLEIALRFVEGQPGANVAMIFQDIADDSPEAEDYLFDVLDEATGNLFSDEFDRLRGNAIIAKVLDMPDGYYMGNNGPRPITDIDHAYAATQLRDTDVERLDDFIDCNSVDSDFDYDERMTKLVEILQHLTQDTFKMTGIAQLYIFDPIFLTAVFNSFSKAKMALRVDRDRDEIRGRRGNRSGSSFGIQYDSIRGGRDRDRNRDRSSRGGSRRRHGAW